MALGSYVGAIGAGDACPDWPLCHGRWIPPPDPMVWLEWYHRLLGAAVGLLTIGALVWTYRLGQSGIGLRPLAWAALGLVVFQGLLGGAVVLSGLEVWLVVAHLGTAMLFVATIVTLHLRTAPADREGPPLNQRQRAFRGLVLTTMISVLVLILFGGYVSRAGAGLACPDWPLCRGAVFPPLEPGVLEHYTHRLWAVLSFVLLAWVMVRARRDRPDVRRLTHLVAGLYHVQILVGLFNLLTFLDPAVVSAHLAIAAAIWGLLVAVFVRSGIPLPAVERAAVPAAYTGGVRQTVLDYLSLTKPRIIVLLLVTTAATMFVAAHGRPSAVLVLATIIGGALAAGAANAINCVLDRDLDAVMRRTRRRAIPTGRASPRTALLFGLVLAGLSFWVLSRAVNPLSAWLALSGIVFYVLVYTMWLKRTTPQNIVIGGAAGAIPPLVAWAAVTGRVEWPAVLLFGIVFLWTPPHFWALALNMRDDYAAAGIPMLPVVRGETETHRQMFWYGAATVAVTIALVPVAGMGALYAAVAAALGAIFLYKIWALWHRGPVATALGVYRYSLLYLGLLFSAMAADRVVGL
jgi:protoheme IX farnesyltransferase